MEIGKPLTENARIKANACYFLLKKTNGFLSKEEIGNELGIKNERTVRDVISLVATKVPIISTSDNKGYKMAKTVEDLEEVIHTWKEFDSRIASYEERKKPLIKFYEKMKKGE